MQCVALDIGNVLCHFDMNKFTKELTVVTGITDHDSYFFLQHIQSSQDLNITTVAESLEYRFQLTGPQIDELVTVWNSTVEPADVMMNWLENLRSEGVKIALLSNMGPEHIGHLRQKHPKIFKDARQHISCEVGARKPSKLFFQSFLMDNDDFRGCLYIDDLEENLKSGKHYGFQVYNFKLNEFIQEPLSVQKRELDKLRAIILNRA